MASRHFSLNMNDLGDTTDMLAAFEEQNNVRITLELGLGRTGSGAKDLVITAHAWKTEESTEAPLLASVNVPCLATNLKTLGAALLHATYALDFQLALLEWDSAKPKKT